MRFPGPREVRTFCNRKNTALETGRPEVLLDVTAHSERPQIKVDLLESHFSICKMKNFPNIFLCSKILELPKVTRLVSDKSLYLELRSPGGMFFLLKQTTWKDNAGGNSKNIWKLMFIHFLWRLLVLGRLWMPTRRGAPNTSEPPVGLPFSHLSIYWVLTCLGVGLPKMGPPSPESVCSLTLSKGLVSTGKRCGSPFLFPFLVVVSFREPPSLSPTPIGRWRSREQLTSFSYNS